ncbi:hypothetical protein PVAND_002468 [Polypedilum vanderplanki]|uniref:Uncharacterized protein n=1 Tax=Polypedilum vanderplanki TaxID=319348 RepID=A0A9J6BSM3_POLVA|nr:hypothetical protein PVAND_002468 [Polypedilum vanderplanki]
MLCSAPVCTRRSQSAAFHDLHASRTVFEPMLLCFTCNRISHVKCNGLTIETFKEQHLPWTCKHCQSDIHNPIATAYMNETSYELPLKARRKHFLRAEAAADPIIIGDDEEIEFDEVDTQAFSKEYDSWTAFHTAADVSHLEKDNRVLREELERIKAELESTKRSSTSQQQNYSEIFRKNSTTMPGDTSSSFDFSRHFNQSSYNFDQSRNNASSQSETNTPNTSSRQNYTTTQADVSEVLNRFTITQQQLLDEQLLSTRRKMMPKITDFDGDATKWIEFSQDVERYQRVLKYDDETIKLHLRGALKGQAFEAVKSVFNLLSLQQLIEILKNDFGDPMLVVAKSEKALKEYKLKGELFREDALKLRQLIQGYFSSCIYANTGYLNSNYLADQTYRQFRQDVRIKIREFFVSKHPNKVVVLDLSIIHDFLLSYIPLLDPKAFQKTDTIEAEKRNKANQINYTVSASNSKDKDATEWKFQISNKEAAPYLGYDMQKNTENAKKALENAENANNNAVGSVSRTDSSPQSSIQSSFCAHETKQYQMRDGHVGSHSN